MEYLYQSIAKGDFPNEDALRIFSPGPGRLIAGLADGAGGEGVFTGEWARYLLKHLPDEPFVGFEGFQKWLDQIWEPFYAEHREKARQASPQHEEQFLTEGSASTLVIAWMDTDGKVDCLGYGDSLLLGYDPYTCELVVHPPVPELCAPLHLVNCLREPERKALSVYHFALEKGQSLLLASDAIGKFLVAAYLANQEELYRQNRESHTLEGCEFSNLLHAMRDQPSPCSDFGSLMKNALASLESEAEFHKFTRKWQEKNCLPLDDYTLAFIKYE